MSVETGTILRGPVSSGMRDPFNKRIEKRREIYHELPVNAAPIAKTLFQLPSREISQVEIHWSAERFNPLMGTVLDVYTNEGLSSAYESGGIAGSMLYLAMTADDAKQVVVGEQLLLVTATTESHRLFDAVSVKIGTDSSSYVLGRLLEDDTSNTLAEATHTWRIVSSGYPELSGLPESVYEEPVWNSNYAEIFMSAHEVSGTEMETSDDLSEHIFDRRKKQSLDRIHKQIERAIMHGMKHVGVSTNGHRRLFMGGLRRAIAASEADNLSKYPALSAYAGKTWGQGGWNWLKTIMGQISRYSPNPKYVWCGDLALMAIQDLIEDNTTTQIGPREKGSYGIDFRTLHGLNCDLMLHQHPLMSTDSAFRRSMLIMEPELVTWCPFKNRDITYVTATQREELKKAINRTDNGFNWVDGFKEGWFCQGSLEYDNLASMAWLDGVGIDNPLTP